MEAIGLCLACSFFLLRIFAIIVELDVSMLTDETDASGDVSMLTNEMDGSGDVSMLTTTSAAAATTSKKDFVKIRTTKTIVK